MKEKDDSNREFFEKIAGVSFIVLIILGVLLNDGTRYGFIMKFILEVPAMISLAVLVLAMAIRILYF